MLTSALVALNIGSHRIKKIHRKLHWGSLILLMQKSYLIVWLCIFITLQYSYSYEGIENTVQTSLCMTFAIFFTLAPIAVFTFLIKKFRKLQDKQLSSRFKILYERLELKKGIIVLIQPIFFLFRRLILTLSVVLVDQTLIWQVMLLYFQVIASIIIISYIEVEKTIYR